MKRKMLESEKNMVRCAVILCIVGILLVLQGSVAMGIGSVICAFVFVGIAVRMININKKEEEKQEKLKAKEKAENDIKAENDMSVEEEKDENSEE